MNTNDWIDFIEKEVSSGLTLMYSYMTFEEYRKQSDIKINSCKYNKAFLEKLNQNI